MNFNTAFTICTVSVLSLAGFLCYVWDTAWPLLLLVTVAFIKPTSTKKTDNKGAGNES